MTFSSVDVIHGLKVRMKTTHDTHGRSHNNESVNANWPINKNSRKYFQIE